MVPYVYLFYIKLSVNTSTSVFMSVCSVRFVRLLSPAIVLLSYY